MSVKIGVFSDTHGDIGAIEGLKDRLGTLDYILHLGDYACDAAALGQIFYCPHYAVRGNCDYHGSNYPKTQVVELGNKRFFLTHGDGFINEQSLYYSATEQNCDAIFFGHSHVPSLSAQGRVLILNPGSLSRPRFGSPRSCALATIDQGELYIKLIN